MISCEQYAYTWYLVYSSSVYTASTSTADVSIRVLASRDFAGASCVCLTLRWDGIELRLMKSQFSCEPQLRAGLIPTNRGRRVPHGWSPFTLFIRTFSRQIRSEFDS